MHILDRSREWDEYLFRYTIKKISRIQRVNRRQILVVAGYSRRYRRRPEFASHQIVKGAFSEEIVSEKLFERILSSGYLNIYSAKCIQRLAAYYNNTYFVPILVPDAGVVCMCLDGSPTQQLSFNGALKKIKQHCKR